MILLIGNILSRHGLNPTAIEDLIETLAQKYEIKFASNKMNSLLRLLDMISLVILNRKKCNVIIVDVFGTKAIFFAICVILLAKMYKIPYIPVLRGGYFTFKTNYILPFPIPKTLPVEIVNEIEKLVKDILLKKNSLEKNETLTQEKMINDFIYQLYDLSVEDINTIESNKI